MEIFNYHGKPKTDSAIYITEQTTPLYRLFKKRYPNLVGSEFLGDLVPFGSEDERGMRNESLTQLSFQDNSFDYILSYEVLEHVPDYEQALREILRCLKSGGMFFFSVPFRRKKKRTLVRASIDFNGEVIHHERPEYHGDPINSGGCLCFYHFGWEFLDKLKEIGFKTARVAVMWSPKYGHFGGCQLQFVATK